MSRFFLGQRVRIKWSVTWPWLAGTEGLIVDFANPKRCVKGHKGDWIVTPDGYDGPRLPDADSEVGYSTFAPTSEQLEPLTDSNDLVSWESMLDLWVPEHLRVKA